MDLMIAPGPLDSSVLRLQRGHRSEVVWRGDTDKVLSCRQHLLSLEEDWDVDERVLHYVRVTGFFGVHRLKGGGAFLNRSLITAFVERWRRETHTFHLTVGEATITLQDVAVLMGLRVHDDAVIGHGVQPWTIIVEKLLGVRPAVDPETGKTVLKGSTLKLSWLKRHFRHLPPDADDDTVQKFSRAYILILMGSHLFANKSSDRVSLLYLPLL